MREQTSKLVPLLLLASALITTGCMTLGRTAYSPDGKQVALRLVEGGLSGVAIHDLASGSTRRLLEPTAEVDQVDASWNADGTALLVIGVKSRSHLRITRVDPGSGQATSEEYPFPWPGETALLPVGPPIAADGWIGPLIRKEPADDEPFCSYVRLDRTAKKLEALRFMSAALFLEPVVDGALCWELTRKPKPPAAPAAPAEKPPPQPVYLSRLKLPEGTLERLRELTVGQEGPGEIPVLSPDGRRLASMVTREDVTSVTIRDRKGEELLSIPLPAKVESGGPGTWRGDRLYFLTKQDRAVALQEVDVEARSVRALPLDRHVEAGEISLIGPALSPDGSQVAIPAYRTGAWGKQIDTRLVLVDLEPVRSVPITPAVPASPGPSPER